MPTIYQVVNEKFENDIQAAMKKWSVRGCTVVVVQGDQHRILTFRYRDRTELVTSKTLFALASCSKLFTALAVIRALSQNNLSINTKIKSIIPSFKLYDKVAEENCTVEDILTHRTGIPGYDHLIWTPSYSKFDLLERIGRLKPTMGFREGYQYNSVFYDLLIILVEKLTGMGFREYMRGEFFEKAGMGDVTYDYDQDSREKEYAKGYWKESSVSHQPERERLDEEKENRAADQKDGGPEGLLELNFGLDKLGEKGGLGTGRLWISGEDLVKWLQYLPTIPEYAQCLIPRIIADSSGGLELPDHKILYGLAQRISTHRGVLVQEHTGEIPGFLSRTSRIPEYNVGFGILTNSDPGGKYLRSLVKCKLIEGFAGLDKIDWFTKIDTIRQSQISPLSEPPESPKPVEYPKEDVENHPLIGTWRNDAFDPLNITKSSMYEKLPQMENIPYIPHQYGRVRYIFSSSPSLSDGRRYEGCVEWVPGCATGEDKIYGFPFKVELVGDNDKDNGENDDRCRGMRVYGMMGVGEGLDEDDFGILFRRD